MHVALDRCVLPMEAVLLVADGLHGVPRGLFHRFGGDRCRSAHFTGQHDTIGRAQGFAGNARVGISSQEKIYDRIGDLIAHLIGMAFRDGFTREHIVSLGQGLLLAWDWR
jgi:hypothetical protein